MDQRAHNSQRRPLLSLCIEAMKPGGRNARGPRSPEVRYALARRSEGESSMEPEGQGARKAGGSVA